MAQQCTGCRTVADDDIAICEGCGDELWPAWPIPEAPKYWRRAAILAAGSGAVAGAFLLYVASTF